MTKADEPARPAGRPRQLFSKDDPRYQPTPEEMQRRTSLSSRTPHRTSSRRR